jgi:hypothetical protein
LTRKCFRSKVIFSNELPAGEKEMNATAISNDGPASAPPPMIAAHQGAMKRQSFSSDERAATFCRSLSLAGISHTSRATHDGTTIVCWHESDA